MNLELFNNNYFNNNFQLNIDENIFKKYNKTKRMNNCDNIMHYFESHLYNLGYNIIAGLDEAGRGSIAGPVVVAAVILPKNYFIKKLYDSKALNPNERKKIFNQLTTNPDIIWSIGIVENYEIDKINILNATYKAAFLAYSNLKTKPDILLNDALIIPQINIKQLKIIKGDTKSASIAAASIIAKVTRDNIMDKYDKIFPQYEFYKHKGYATNLHIQNINKFGLCEIHRKSFQIQSLNETKELI